ncbi:hypothetical protein D3C72_2236040 [compost metagenome]
MTFKRGPVFLGRLGCVMAGAAPFRGQAYNVRGTVIGGRLGTDPTGSASRPRAAVQAGRVEPWSTARNASPFGGDMTFERGPVFS